MKKKITFLLIILVLLSSCKGNDSTQAIQQSTSTPTVYLTLSTEQNTVESQDERLYFTEYRDGKTVIGYITGDCLTNACANLVYLQNVPMDEDFMPPILWTPDGRFFATQSNVSGHYAIIVSDPDATSVYSIGSPNENLWPTDWSPDGKFLLADKEVNNGQASTQVWKINVATQAEEYVADGCCAKWFPSGQEIFYIGYDNESKPDIFRLDIASGVSVNLTNSPELFEQGFSLSPDGTKIAYTISDSSGDLSVYVSDVNLSQPPLVLANVSDPLWSPSGSKIALLFNQTRTTPPEIFVWDLLTNEMIEISNSPGYASYNLAWSPDGSQIVFVSLREGIGNLYLTEVNSLQTQRITNVPNVEFGNPVWQPAHFLVASATTEIQTQSTQTQSTPTPIKPISSPTAVPASDECTSHNYIEICIEKIARTETDTQVTLKVLVESNMVDGSGGSFIHPDYENLIYPVLLDEQGNSYPLKDNADNYWSIFDDVERVYLQTLYFQPVPADAKEFTLSLPMITVDIPANIANSVASEKYFMVDLGENPQPGQALDLDVTTVIDGQTFHFVEAEFEGDGTNSLRVTLYTDPLNLPSDIYAMSPLFGDLEKGAYFGTKQGVNGLPLRTFAELILPPGKSSGQTGNIHISGVLNLEVSRITYWYRGPFEITIQLP